MKKVLFTWLLITLLSCNNKKDIDDIKIGMTATEVVKILGEPKEKLDNVFGQFYSYGDNLIIFDNNVVTMVTNKLKNKALNK